MIVFTNCKINLGLHITGKRDDGYHNLETLFFPVPLYDVLELTDAAQTSLTLSGQPIAGDIEDNIILKAYGLLKQDFPRLPAVHFYLLKNIPAGAGLGAGSANGAGTLEALNQKFQLRLDADRLAAYALQLGSDCPFFLYNSPCLATGRGQLLTPVPLDLSAFNLLLVNPRIHISTAGAFSRITPRSSPIDIQSVMGLSPAQWKQSLTNDFEEAVFQVHPVLDSLKAQLYDMGAVFALMSGSGSTLYGLFNKGAVVETDFPAHYFIRQLEL